MAGGWWGGLGELSFRSTAVRRASALRAAACRATPGQFQLRLTRHCRVVTHPGVPGGDSPSTVDSAARAGCAVELGGRTPRPCREDHAVCAGRRGRGSAIGHGPKSSGGQRKCPSTHLCIWCAKPQLRGGGCPSLSESSQRKYINVLLLVERICAGQGLGGPKDIVTILLSNWVSLPQFVPPCCPGRAAPARGLSPYARAGAVYV